MKKRISTWALRLAVTALFVAVLLVVIIINPALTYAHKTTYGNYTIFHNQPPGRALMSYLDQATRLAGTSEYYNPGLKLDICLNDGSLYPAGIRKLWGRAFARGFYNKVVLMENTYYPNNYVELNGYRWNLTQVLAHEMIHCFQFNKRGLWNSNPLARIPEWKWEGYPEYIARQHSDQKDLAKNIDRLVQAEQTSHNGWISFADSTGTLLSYYRHWLLVQYCMNIRKMTYDQVIEDTTGQETLQRQMMDWYKAR